MQADVTQWHFPAIPVSGWGMPVALGLRDALITPFRHGRFEGVGSPTLFWHAGAVHDSDGRLIPQSQRIGGLGGDQYVATDPGLIAWPAGGVGVRLAPPERLEGSWYYGGYWFTHFGHWLVETFPGLAAHRDENVVFHPFMRVTVEPYQQRLLELAGVPGSPRFVDGPLRVESLTVPARQSAVNGFISPEAVALFQRIGAAVSPAPEGDRRIWLSRTQLRARAGALTGPDRMIANELALDDLFEGLGFEIVHPQELDIEEQIRVVRGAKMIAGVEGSALHLSLFVPPGLRVVVLGSARRPRGNYGQRVVDGAVGHHQALVPFLADDAGHLDLKHVRRAMRRLLRDAEGLPGGPAAVLGMAPLLG